MPNIDTQTNELQLPEVNATLKAHASLKLEDIPEPQDLINQDSVELVGPVTPVDAQASSELVVLPEAPALFVLPMVDQNKGKLTWRQPSVPQINSLSDLHCPHSFINTIPAPEWSYNQALEDQLYT